MSQQDPSKQMVGQEVGNYILQKKLGEGGMGEVYLARHKNLDILAAVKVMAPAFSHDPKLRERFSREARTQAQLRHPHIAPVLDHIEHDGRWFMIIEYMENGTLEDVLEKRSGPLPEEQALAWARQALEGLNYAHGKGIIHRDIKPANILLNERGEAAVTDFGIAMVVGAQRLTRTGSSIGTPDYMSPEQIQGREDLDHRTDVYSMGIVLYELLGGRLPFEASSTFEVMERQVKEAPPPLRDLRPEIVPQLEALVFKALAKDPAQRFTSCGEFAAAITAYQNGEQPVALKSSRATVFEAPGATGPPPVPPASAVPASSPRSRTVFAPTTNSGDVAAPPPKRSRGSAIAMVAVLVALAVAFFWWSSREPDGGDSAIELASALRTAEQEAENARLASEAAAGALEQTRQATVQAQGASGEAKNAASGRQCSLARKASKSSHDAASQAEQAAQLATAEAAKADSAATAARDAEVGTRSVNMAAFWYRFSLAVLVAPVAYADEDPDEKDEAQLREDLEQAVRRAEEASAAAQNSATAAGASAEEARQAATWAAEAANSCQAPPPPPEPRIPPPNASIPPPTPPPIPPPMPPQALPEHPVVAVMVVGDPVLAAPLEEQLERRLLQSRFDVRDERGSLQLDDLLEREGERVSFSDVVPILAQEGFHVAVIVKIEVGDRREARFHGQSMTMTAARLRLNARSLITGKTIGRGWSERMEYTELSAEAKGKQAFIGATADLANAIRDSWAALRQGGG